MLQSLIQILFLMFLTELCTSTIHKPSPSKNINHPNHCYDVEMDAYYPPDGRFHQRKGYCEEVKCFDDFSWTTKK